MKRFFASALVLGSLSLVGLSGCEDKTEVKDVKTVTTPEGTVKETDTKKVEATGDAKPAPAPTTDAPKVEEPPKVEAPK